MHEKQSHHLVMVTTDVCASFKGHKDNENSQEHSSHLSFLINCQSLSVKLLQSYSFHFHYKVVQYVLSGSSVLGM